MSAANMPITNTLAEPGAAAQRASGEPLASSTTAVQRRCAVIVEDRVAIPDWISDLESYRRWAHSEDYPGSGWISFLDGAIWVDMTMEELLTHNQVKFAYTVTIGNCLTQDPLGRFVVDRMLLTNAQARLSTEPDGLFYLWSTIQSGRLRRVPGKQEGYMELDGTPDMVMEIVSKSSIRKDKEVLRDLYWRAEIGEYWLIDALDEPAHFDILRRTNQGYDATTTNDGWVRSQVFGREFRLVQRTDPLGDRQFVVEMR
jgi:Uma2 family endonuclease